jgi:hypothetical protein
MAFQPFISKAWEQSHFLEPFLELAIQYPFKMLVNYNQL